jgi:hypothetical protein
VPDGVPVGRAFMARHANHEGSRHNIVKSALDHENGDGRTEVGFRGVEKFGHERVAIENLLNDTPLDAATSAMDQPNLCQSGGVRRADVFVDDRRNVCGEEGMKIEAGFNGDLHGRLISRAFRT